MDTTYKLNVPATVGLKYDADKPLYSLLKPEALEEMVKVLTYGAKKYSPDNWRHVSDLRRRYFDATQRHVWAWQSGETNDPESGLHHLAHAMCSLMFILQVDLEERKSLLEAFNIDILDDDET